MSYSDPFGLKVCFKGNPSQRTSLIEAAEAGTNSSIEVGDDGCVTSFNPGGGKQYQHLQDAFAAMVNDDATINVQFADSTEISNLDSETRTATLNPLAIQRKRYVEGGVLACFFGGSGTAPFTLPAIFVHELIGHGSPMAGGGSASPSGIWAGNVYHAATNQPRRCSEYK